MSVFTNPASGAAEQATAYTRATLALVAGRDPIDILGTTPDALRQATAGLGNEALAKPEADGKWSIGQALRHLADCEIVWAWRLRMALAQDRPSITGFDQDAWATRLAYADADPGESIETFALLRGGHLTLLDGIRAEDLRRVAVHEERGEETVAHMLRMQAGHDLVHLRQIDRIRKAVG